MKRFTAWSIVSTLCLLLLLSCGDSPDSKNVNNTPKTSNVSLSLQYKALGVVDEKGGTRCAKDGICVEIPSGLVEKGEKLTVSARLARSDDKDTGGGSPVFEFKSELRTKDGTLKNVETFKKELTITIPISKQLQGKKNLSMAFFEPYTGNPKGRGYGAWGKPKSAVGRGYGAWGRDPGTASRGGAPSSSGSTQAGRGYGAWGRGYGAWGNVPSSRNGSNLAGRSKHFSYWTILSPCPNDQVRCFGTCADLKTSKKFCGNCMIACDAGQTCKEGQCVPEKCPEGQIVCGTQCTKIKSNVNHCGACNQKCASGKSCCNGVCTDSMKNAKHCGVCNNPCPPGQGCEAGLCKCSPDQTLCSNGCANLKTDRNHCGACNNACKTGVFCTEGQCKLACPSTQTPCSGVCTDTQSNRAHCGACNNTCKAGEVCVQGACQTSCPTGQVACSKLCVDVQTNPTHCGACGNPCKSGQECKNGKCTCQTGYTDCNGDCVDLTSSRSHCGRCGNSCTKASVCSNGTCQTNCSSGQTNCSGACVTLNDSKHCGACGNACKAGESCCKNTCVKLSSNNDNCGKCGAACSDKQACCSGTCTEVETNTNCGACGKACSTGQICSSGLCCKSGEVNCNGKCVDLSKDKNNCGKCGKICPFNQSCNSQKCGCPTGQQLCTIRGLSICADLSSDNNNCGKCSNSCKIGQQCKNGVCTTTCPAGQVVCDSLCTDLSSSTQNCGQCGRTCPPLSFCSNSSCICNTGLKLCNGTCSDTQKDSAHCGGCGKACNSSQICRAGTCTTFCSSGKTNCNGTCADLQTDRTNCGACNAICLAQESCYKGKCALLSTAGGSLDDRATDVDIDANGNIYVLGTFFTTTTFGTLKLTSAGSTDVFLAKYNSAGTLLWAKQFGGTGEDRAGTLQVGPQQNIYITGSFKNTAKFGPTSLKSSGDFDIFASKISSSGNLLWIKKAGGTGFDLGVDLALDVDPNGKGVCYIVGQYSATATFGTTQLTSAGSQDVFVARLSATNGSFSWTQSILNGTSEITSHSIIVDPNRDLVITGSYLGIVSDAASSVSLFNSGSRDIFVVKLSNSGVLRWARKIGSSGEESALQVETQISSDLTLIGYSKSQTLVFGSTTLTGKGKAFLFVAKLSSFGNWLWAKKAGNDLHESFAQGVTVEPFGDSYITGLFSGVATFGTTTLTSKGNFDIFVAKIDNKGNFQWAERAGGSQRDSGNSILYNGKNFFVVGEFEGTSTIGSQSLTSKGRKDYFLWRFSRP